MLSYSDSTHNTTGHINVEEINTLFRIIDVLVDMHKGLYANAKKTVVKMLQT